jgi:hypothetical protein
MSSCPRFPLFPLLSCLACLRGPLGWLVPTEIQPLETRSAGTALNACVNFAGTFLISQVFLSMLCGLKWGVFLFFAGESCMPGAMSGAASTGFMGLGLAWQAASA